MHRDVKPANLLITPDGPSRSPTSASPAPATASPLTRTGEVMGTAAVPVARAGPRACRPRRRATSTRWASSAHESSPARVRSTGSRRWPRRWPTSTTPHRAARRRPRAGARRGPGRHGQGPGAPPGQRRRRCAALLRRCPAGPVTPLAGVGAGHGAAGPSRPRRARTGHTVGRPGRAAAAARRVLPRSAAAAVLADRWSLRRAACPLDTRRPRRRAPRPTTHAGRRPTVVARARRRVPPRGARDRASRRSPSVASGDSARRTPAQQPTAPVTTPSPTPTPQHHHRARPPPACGRRHAPAPAAKPSSTGKGAGQGGQEEVTPPLLLGGRYEVGDLLGRGGMAEVHLGRDTRLGRARWRSRCCAPTWPATPRSRPGSAARRSPRPG